MHVVVFVFTACGRGLFSHGLFALSKASCLPFVSAKNISNHEALSSLLIYRGQSVNLDQ